MKPPEKTKAQFAICVNNDEYPASLEIHKVYRVLEDKEAEREGDLRVVDESGEDYLYPAENFVLMELPSKSAQTLVASFLAATSEPRYTLDAAGPEPSAIGRQLSARQEAACMNFCLADS